MRLPPLTIIPASAGSGKTHHIQEQLTEWVIKGAIKPERIIAVTFTEAAATELRERIRFALLTAPEVDMEQVLSLDQAYITTFHGFGLRLLQEYCFEGGWSPQPRLISEDEGDILIRQALAVTRKADSIMADLSRFGYCWNFTKGSAEDQFRSQLSQVIKKYLILGISGIKKNIKGHLLAHIKALYGRTGKATTLENRLRSAVKRLLQKFPDSMADLYPDNGTFVRAMTANHRDLTRAAKKNVLRNDWWLWVSLQTLRISMRGSALPENYNELAEEVMKAALELRHHPGPLDDALTHAEAIVDAAQDCLTQHTKLKRDRCLVDYGDMLSLAHELIVNSQDVLHDLSRKVDCVVIDEFQDTNPLQFSLLWALYRQGIPTLVVGDVKQAIMGFQDADSRLMEALEKSSVAKCSPLLGNWRTVKPLMKFLNAAGTGLFPDSYQELTPMLPVVSKFEPIHFINFTKYSVAHSFYGDHVASHIKSILTAKRKVLTDGSYRPVRGSDIAILLPTNKLIETYAESFRQAGLQVQIDKSGWFESRSVQLLYYSLLFAADPNDRHAALYLTVTELGQGSLQNCLKGLINGEMPSDPILEKLQELREYVQIDAVSSLVQKMITVLDIFTTVSLWPDTEQERANILRFLAEAEEFSNITPETLEASGLYGFGPKTFLAWLVKRGEADNTMPCENVVEHNAVQFSTWHSAKGREWPIVAVCGTSRQYSPKLPSLDIQYQDFSDFDKILQKAAIEFSPTFADSMTNEAFKRPLEDEVEENARRLLYVAMTRAKEHLILEQAGYQEGKDKSSNWNLLCDCTGMDVDSKAVTLGTKTFSCRQTIVEKDAAEFDDSTQDRECKLSGIGTRALKTVPLPETTLATASPSMLAGDKRPQGTKIITKSYGPPLTIDLRKDAAETGTILHRCFEVLGRGEDRTDLLKAATGCDFTKKQTSQLQNNVAAFETWCYEKFGKKATMNKELPLSYQDENGVIISGIIDLLIETPAGYWVIDHKTHKPENMEKEFWNYWPQLQAYCNGVAGGGKKKVLGVGVHWVVEAAVSQHV